VFGNANPGAGTGCASPDCFVGPDTRLAQSVEVKPGRYRVSWYARPVIMTGGGSSIAAAAAVALRTTGPALTLSAVGNAGVGEGQWQRYFRIFDVPSDQVVEVSIQPTQSGASQQIDIAALMLEDLSDQGRYGFGADASVLPKPKAYMNTGDTSEALLPVCEDTTGEQFRAKAWRPGCVRLCPDGLRANCAASTAQERCYWETSFSLSQRDIEGGRILTQSGFAQGNFNYRLSSLGLNFVGSQTRDCGGSATPSSCFSAGFLPYTVEHLGPYMVRNYEGDEYEAQLFTGRIEHARGLAAERYLTNPLSSADSQLITPYLRGELSGRPLDGTYVLRVWDEPGVHFEGVEDVQVVLNYGYWTRFH